MALKWDLRRSKNEYNFGNIKNVVGNILANTSVRRINFLDYLLKVHRFDVVAYLASPVWLFIYIIGETKRGWGRSERFGFKKAEKKLTGIPTTLQGKYESAEEFTVCSKPKTSTFKSTFYYVGVMSYRLYRRTKEGIKSYHRKILEGGSVQPSKWSPNRPRNDTNSDICGLQTYENSSIKYICIWVPNLKEKSFFYYWTIVNNPLKLVAKDWQR